MYKAYTKKEIIENEKKVDDFFTDRQIVLYPKTEMVPLARKLGFNVVAFTPDETVDGIILVNNDKKYIGVNKRLSEKKLRFVIAHELGHYIYSLESGKNKLLALKDHIFHNEEKSDLENLMDYYAAAILVPMKQFRDLKSKYKIGNYQDENAVMENISYDKLTDLAEKFNVEVGTIVRRIIEAGCYES